MSCIHCSTPLNLFTLRNQRQNAGKFSKFCWFYSTNKHSSIISKAGVFPLKVEDFADSLNLAVVKPADPQVLIQTSALLLFVYFISNFVVPQLLSKSFEQEDENKTPDAKTDSTDKEKASSTTTKRGFNSTKPK